MNCLYIWKLIICLLFHLLYFLQFWGLFFHFVCSFLFFCSSSVKNAIGNLIGTALNLGEGNGTPLQYSWLENPIDGGAWWAAIYAVTQSRRRLKWLSSSSSSSNIESADCICQYSNFYDIDSSYSGTWNISPSAYVIFNFFHQCLIIFHIQFFCLLW